MGRRMTHLGKHALIEGKVKKADLPLLGNGARLEGILAQACRASGAKVVDGISHYFTPHGVTSLLALAESHAVIHTWPEHGVWIADVFL